MKMAEKSSPKLDLSDYISFKTNKGNYIHFKFKGNGLTVYDRNQEVRGDFKDIAHIGEDGKITIWDKNIKKEPKLMQSLKKISQEFKTSFKESVNEAKENPIDAARRIVKNSQSEKVGGVLVDMQTANLIVQIYDKVNSSNKKKMEKTPMKKLGVLVWKVAKKARR